MSENVVQTGRSQKRRSGHSGYVTQRENARSLDHAELLERQQFCSARDDNDAMKMSGIRISLHKSSPINDGGRLLQGSDGDGVFDL